MRRPDQLEKTQEWAVWAPKYGQFDKRFLDLVITSLNECVTKPLYETKLAIEQFL